MSGPIIHTPYDLGLGFKLGVNSPIRVSAYCLMESCQEQLNLFWELEGAEKPMLLIRFDSALVVRVLDEMWSSTEIDPARWRGVDGSFARIIEGSEYPTGSDYLKALHSDAKHYEFITDDDCVDVIALDRPRAKLIEFEELESYRLKFPRLG